LAIINRIASGETITFQVVEGESILTSSFTTKFVDGQFTPVQPGKNDGKKRFTLHRQFLETVIAHPSAYIDHPEKLDWSWLGPA
jgi:hypothetical protein